MIKSKKQSSALFAELHFITSMPIEQVLDRIAEQQSWDITVDVIAQSPDRYELRFLRGNIPMVTGSIQRWQGTSTRVNLTSHGITELNKDKNSPHSSSALLGLSTMFILLGLKTTTWFLGFAVFLLLSHYVNKNKPSVEGWRTDTVSLKKQANLLIDQIVEMFRQHGEVELLSSG